MRRAPCPALSLCSQGLSSPTASSCCSAGLSEAGFHTEALYGAKAKAKVKARYSTCSVKEQTHWASRISLNKSGVSFQEHHALVSEHP